MIRSVGNALAAIMVAFFLLMVQSPDPESWFARLVWELESAHLFTNTAFTPHLVCYNGDKLIEYTNVWSDFATGLAYLAIPNAISWLLNEVQHAIDIRALRPRFDWLAAFVFICGLNHFAAAITVYVPLYEIQSVTKLSMAMVSVAVAADLYLGRKKILTFILVQLKQIKGHNA